MRFGRFSALCALILLVMAKPALAQKYVCMQSNKGEWCMELLRSDAPGTVNNFLSYVNNGAYNNMMFHRLVPGFVVQGGGFTADSQSGLQRVSNYGTINNEYHRSNQRGTVAMAKLSSGPNTASNQWFINLGDNSANLDNQNGGFTVFAQIVYGMDVVDKIAGFRVGNLASAFGSTEFAEVPVDIPATATSIELNDLVIVNRAYTTDTLPGVTIAPYHCTAPLPDDALTELCGTTVSFPVVVNGLAYDATIELIASSPAPVFALQSLKSLAGTPASVATFNQSTLMVTIPSVRTGSIIYDNVQLLLTNQTSRQFTLKGFTPRR